MREIKSLKWVFVVLISALFGSGLTCLVCCLLWQGHSERVSSNYDKYPHLPEMLKKKVVERPTFLREMIGHAMERIEKIASKHGSSPEVIGNCMAAEVLLKTIVSPECHNNNPIMLWASMFKGNPAGPKGILVNGLNPNRETCTYIITTLNPNGCVFLIKSTFQREEKSTEIMEQNIVAVKETSWESILQRARVNDDGIYEIVINQSDKFELVPIPIDTDLAIGFQDRSGRISNFVKVAVPVGIPEEFGQNEK